MLDSLYNTDILSLAASLRNTALQAPCGTARKVSKLCGSELEIDIKMNDGVVSMCALRIQACALGQASAAILKNNIVGAKPEEVIIAAKALRAMLKENGPAPYGRFAKLALLNGVRAYPARHISTMLAFDAAVEAIAACQAEQA